MKKIAALLSLLLLAAGLSACAGALPEAVVETGEDREQTELTLWAFPVGNWGNPTAVNSILTSFHKKHPDIHITVEYLTYDTGDERVVQAAEEGTLPDLVLEGPERLISNWGDQGWMADLTDLWSSPAAGEVYDNVREACRHRNGEYYVLPICMSAHCMAINYDLFREAGALSYIDEEHHTWTTEGFVSAVEALTAYGQECVGQIYCRNQSGDQGTRALVNNLFGGTFTDEGHTAYTVDSPENRAALELLRSLEGITFEPDLTSAEAISLFCRKETAMCFCWNASMEVLQTINNPDLDFEVFPMAFPADGEAPRLEGGIWGFGIFEGGGEERLEASKTFLRYITENDGPYIRAVRTSSYWPVRDMGEIYENDVLMTEYSIFTPYMGSYCQITPGWTQARTAWWQLLAEIGAGADIAGAVKGFPN